MAEINPVIYSQVAQSYGLGLDQLDGVDQHFYDAAYNILTVQDFDPAVQLLIPLFSAYETSVTAFEAPAPLITAVATLQKHILSKAVTGSGGKYTDINDWLADHGVTVPQSFADLSAEGGFEIDDDNIAPSIITPVVISCTRLRLEFGEGVFRWAFNVPIQYPSTIIGLQVFDGVDWFDCDNEDFATSANGNLFIDVAQFGDAPPGNPWRVVENAALYIGFQNGAHLVAGQTGIII